MDEHFEKMDRKKMQKEVEKEARGEVQKKRRR
jgi:hypothetical protein